jgi:hypothetical protein
VIRTLALAFLLFLHLTAQAQQPPFATPADVRKFSDTVMGWVGAGKYEDAWKRMKPASIIPPVEFDAFAAQFNSQLPTFTPRYGKPAGFEYIRDQQVGTSLLRFQYIAKYERSATRWIFVFYRTATGWVLTDFKFDGNVSALFPGEA